MQSLALLVAFTLCTMVSQLLIKMGLGAIGAAQRNSGTATMIRAALHSPWMLGAVMVQAGGFLVWLLVLGRLKLGVAFAVAGGFNYLALGVLSGVIFREPLTSWDWIGLALILAGVTVMTLKSVVPA